VVVVCNFTPVAWEGYRVGVPFPGRYDVVLDSGDARFGGAGTLEAASFEATTGAQTGRDQYVELTLPPLTALVLKRSPETRDSGRS
jgi:1,4-alpha-glucan branching enzyme